MITITLNPAVRNAVSNAHAERGAGKRMGLALWREGFPLMRARHLAG